MKESKQEVTKVVYLVKGDTNTTRCIKSPYHAEPSCSKLMTSLVNDSLKFTSSDTQIC